MSWQVIKSLFLMNLLYVNPAKTNLQRIKATKQNKNLQKIIFNNFLLGQLLLVFVSFVVMFLSDLTQAANKYQFITLFVLLFYTMTIMSSFFTIFYEDKDTQHLLPLPITQKEIFASKILTLFSQNSGIVVGFTLINLISSIRISGFNIINLFILFIYSITLLCFVFVLAILLFSFLAKTKLFKQYKNTVTVVVQIIVFLISCSTYAFMSVFMKDNIPISQYKGDLLINTISQTTSIQSLGFVSLIILLLITAIVLLNKFVIKTYFDDIKSLPKAKNKIIKHQDIEDFNLNQIYRKSTLKTFSNGTLIFQNILGPFIIPLLFLGFSIGVSGHSYFYQGLSTLPTSIIVGIILGLSMISSGSFSSLAISVDYKNYEFLKTLPINLKTYYLIKLKLALLIQLPVSILAFLVIMLILNTSLSFLIFSFIPFIIIFMAYAIRQFKNDIKTPFIGWGNIAQLMTRGKSGANQFLKLMGIMLLIVFIIALTVVYTLFLPDLWWLLAGLYSIAILVFTYLEIKSFLNEI